MGDELMLQIAMSIREPATMTSLARSCVRWARIIGDPIVQRTLKTRFACVKVTYLTRSTEWRPLLPNMRLRQSHGTVVSRCASTGRLLWQQDYDSGLRHGVSIIVDAGHNTVTKTNWCNGQRQGFQTTIDGSTRQLLRSVMYEKNRRHGELIALSSDEITRTRYKRGCIKLIQTYVCKPTYLKTHVSLIKGGWIVRRFAYDGRLLNMYDVKSPSDLDKIMTIYHEYDEQGNIALSVTCSSGFPTLIEWPQTSIGTIRYNAGRLWFFDITGLSFYDVSCLATVTVKNFRIDITLLCDHLLEICNCSVCLIPPPSA